MMQQDDPFVTCLTAPDLATAQVMRGALEAHDLECQIPDEHLAGMAWHLSGAIGGVRIQVTASELERAKAIIETLGQQSPQELVDPFDVDDKDCVEDAGDVKSGSEVASRKFAHAYRSAVIGIFFAPLLAMQFYSTLLLYQAWVLDADEVKRHPIKLGITLLFIVLGIWLFVLLARLFMQ
jgi:hypothetical protein